MPFIDTDMKNDGELQDVADFIAASHRVLLVTGAGISTGIGISAFRSGVDPSNQVPEQSGAASLPFKHQPSRKRKASSSDDGEPLRTPTSRLPHLSSNTSMDYAMKLRGQDLFDARLLKDRGALLMFNSHIAALRTKICDEIQGTTITHRFIRTLRDGGRLLRCYAQNIDVLEAREGLCTDLSRGQGTKRRFLKKQLSSPLPANTLGTAFERGCEVVKLHGDLGTLRCTICQTQFPWTGDESETFMEGYVTECIYCRAKSDTREARGKRALTIGTLRPNVLLYGEEHLSNNLLAQFLNYDEACRPEVLIILGTSLHVHGLQKIVKRFAKAVHSIDKGKVIFVNRRRPAESSWEEFIDYFISADCDDWVADLRSRRSDLWLQQGAFVPETVKSAAQRNVKKGDTGSGTANR